MEHDVQAQNDQQDSQDELQAVGDEHSAPGGLTGRDGDSSGIADGLDHRHETLHQSGEGDAEHDDQRGEEHLVAAAGDLQEDAQGRQDQSAQQLVCRTEQGPDVGVADLGQQEAESQSQEGGEVHVAQQLAPALSMLHVVHAEQLLEAHAADTGHGIQTGQSQCGNAHGHKDGSGISGDTEHLKETGDAAAEDLEGSTGSASVIDSQPIYKNCYTYMSFPAMRGTITAISLIGSVADRYGQNASLTITNCYYLDSSANIDFSKLPKYRGEKKSVKVDWFDYRYTNYNSLFTLLNTKDAQEKMLRGDLSYLETHVWDVAKATYNISGLTALTYEQMSNRSDSSTENFQTKLGAGFNWVTNMENGSTIHGKYSFPGSDAALQGQDYPFPTVLRGTDSTGVTVNLHYGAWPKVGMLWNEGIVSLDLIADYVPSSGATKELKLNLFNVPEGTGTKSLEFTYSPEGVVTAKATKNETGDFAVTLKGEGTGAAEVIAKYGDYTARLMVTVTADLKVNLGAESVELNVGNEKTVQLKAVDKKNQAHTATWTVTSDDPAVAEVTEPVGDEITVTGVAAGETQLRIKATCTVGGKNYTATAILPVTVKEISGGG